MTFEELKKQSFVTSLDDNEASLAVGGLVQSPGDPWDGIKVTPVDKEDPWDGFKFNPGAF